MEMKGQLSTFFFSFPTPETKHMKALYSHVSLNDEDVKNVLLGNIFIWLV